MSHHFTYELDERHLRIVLKDREIPSSNEAWHRFERFSEEKNKQSQTSGFNSLKLPLNRQVLVPAAFGFVVVILSMLLFNFINIDNEIKSSESGKPKKNETKALNLPQSSQLINNPVTQVPQQPSMVLNSNLETIEPKKVNVEQEAIVKSIPPKIEGNQPNGIISATTSLSQSKTNTVVPPQQPIKRVRRAEVEVVETQQTQEPQINIPVEEQRDSEVVPN